MCDYFVVIEMYMDHEYMDHLEQLNEISLPEK